MTKQISMPHSNIATSNKENSNNERYFRGNSVCSWLDYKTNRAICTSRQVCLQKVMCIALDSKTIETVKLKIKALTNTLNISATLNGSILGALLSCGKTGNGTL